MRKDLKKLASLISLSLSASVTSTVEAIEDPLIFSADEDFFNASVLNKDVSKYLFAHRSHASHSSHASHRSSSSGATYSAPRAPAPARPAVKSKPKPQPKFQKSDPLGQPAKPTGSIPSYIGSLGEKSDAESLARKKAEYHRKWQEAQKKKKASGLHKGNSDVAKNKATNSERKTPKERRIYIIKRIQLALSFKGYDVGGADGIMGPKTVQAIKKYKQKTGLKGKNLIDKELLNSLGIIGF